MIADAVTTVLCLGLVYNLTARASVMSEDTRRAVRWSFTMQACAAVTLALLPWAYPEARTYCVALLVGATVLVQVVTSQLWQGAPPPQFQVRIAANDSKPAPLRELSEDELRVMWRNGPRS